MKSRPVGCWAKGINETPRPYEVATGSEVVCLLGKTGSDWRVVKMTCLVESRCGAVALGRTYLLPRPRRPVRFGVWHCRSANRLAVTCRSSYGEIEIRGQDIGGVAVHAAAQGHGAIAVERSAGLASRYRPRGRRRPEILRTRIVRAQGSSWSMGFVCRERVAHVRSCEGFRMPAP
jgi:hypothetical protein